MVGVADPLYIDNLRRRANFSRWPTRLVPAFGLVFLHGQLALRIALTVSLCAGPVPQSPLPEDEPSLSRP